MYYTDYHMHSTCSHDGKNTMSEMAAACAKYGLREICFTDHCDLVRPDLVPFESVPMDEMKMQYAQALMEHGTEIKIKFGVELGDSMWNPELEAKILAEELDFVIGSCHVIPDVGELSQRKFETREECLDLIDRYLKVLEEIVRLDNYDVLGHITYPLRYMKLLGGIDVDYTSFYPRLEEMFRKLIYNGRGIEVNTSNFKYPRDDCFTMPDLEILELYRKCGGEIVTLGSDAHCIQHAGVGIPIGYDVLIRAGFKYFTVYDHRKPEFIKL